MAHGMVDMRLHSSSSAIEAIGSRIAASGYPTLVVQEGGYCLSALGDEVARFLRRFESDSTRVNAKISILFR